MEAGQGRAREKMNLRSKLQTVLVSSENQFLGNHCQGQPGDESYKNPPNFKVRARKTEPAAVGMAATIWVY
jgi:hypothetical protein